MTNTRTLKSRNQREGWYCKAIVASIGNRNWFYLLNKRTKCREESLRGSRKDGTHE